MKTFWKGTRPWIFGLLVGLYTTFVLQNLWNWFVATTLNVSQISYWQMFGFNILLQMLFERNGFAEDARWHRMVTMVYACVPADRKGEVDETLKEETENVWLNAGVEVFGKLIGSTVTLGLGWAVHTFLM